MNELESIKYMLKVCVFIIKVIRFGVNKFRSMVRIVVSFSKKLIYLIESTVEIVLLSIKHLIYMIVFLGLTAASLTRSKRARTGGGKKVVMLTISQIEIDPRINKVARNLADEGYEIVIICFWANRDKPRVENPYPGILYKRVPMDKIIYQWQIYFQLSLFRAGMAEHCDMVYANDLTTLLVGWMLSNFKAVPLVYDAHEVWTENVEYDTALKEYVPFKPWKRWLLTKMEGYILRGRVSLFISVSSTICAEYKRRYELTFTPLNLPNFPELTLLDEAGVRDTREQCGLTKEHFMVLYLGGVNPARNIENVILSMQYLPEKCVFVIQGPSIDEYRGEYVELARSVGVEDRVFCLGPVQRDQVIAAASFADCGVLMLRNICLNFYLFYPNKFFEYMLAGLPVAVSNFPEVSAHIAREGCGVTFDPDDPKSIAEALLWLYEHPAERLQMGERGRKSVIERYNWEEAVKQLGKGLKTLQLTH
jgi:glycosyltransferase involved in cell wall biosynthesis